MSSKKMKKKKNIERKEKKKKSFTITHFFAYFFEKHSVLQIEATL